MHISEIILSKKIITEEDWRKLALSIAKHTKGIRPFTLAIIFQENIIRYFLISKKDLSQLSSGIDGVIITNVKMEEQKLAEQPKDAARIRFLRIPTGGTLLDLRERYKLQESLSLDSVFIDVQRIGNRLAAKMHTFFSMGGVHKASHMQLTDFPAHLLKIDFEVNTSYMKKSVPMYLNVEKTLQLLQSDGAGALFSVDGFPYFSQTYFISINNYEFDKHSFIIGASGSGKSKFISLFIDRLSRSNFTRQYRIVVIDPHASIADDLSHIPNNRIINFSGESAQLFPDAASDISAATELTTTLFKSLIADQYNPKLERVLRFSLYVLLVSQSMSMQMLKTFLTDLDTRNQILQHVKDYVPENIIKFFGTDYNEIRTQSYNEAIVPIISLVDEMQMQPTLVGETEMSLAKTIQENFLTVFSLNKVSMGEKVVKTVAGLLIQQIFLLAQARVFGQKVIMIIDEVSIVQNPALASILAEARKFNLTVVLTQQYFGQIEKDLRDAILSNVYNYYVFKISEEDARSLEGNLEINLPDEILNDYKQKGIKESEAKAKIMVELDPRDCIVRVSAKGQLLPSLIARTVDAPIVKMNVDSLTDKELEPIKVKKLPVKFEINKSRFVDDVNLAQEEIIKNHNISNEVAANKLGVFANEVIGVTVQKNFGWSLSELLKKQSSARSIDNLKGDINE